MPDMTKQSFFQSLHRELILRGIWDKSVNKLILDLREHIVEETEQQIAEGHTPADAEAFALQKLGSPEEVAKSAVKERIRNAPWFSRSVGMRVLSGLLLGLVLWMGPILIFTFWSLNYNPDHKLPPFFGSSGYEMLKANLIGYLPSLLIIAWLSFRSKIGWRHLLALTLTIGTFNALMPLLANFCILYYYHISNPAMNNWSSAIYVAKFGILCAIPWVVRNWKLRGEPAYV